MKIYFAGSIRGGRADQELYQTLIKELSNFGQVLTEHLGDKNITSQGETIRTDNEIYERDIAWINEADVLVAEVTTASTGVGYELGYAESLSKPVLCLYRTVQGKRVSAMVSGNKYFTVREYKIVEEAVEIFKEFVK